jgi:hypothetical protein
MDVHAPHEPVHTWKDFFIHLTIVTIGLFIALMLEALVEYVHHRHVVAEARANIRLEIQENHTAAQNDLVLVQQNIDTIKSNIQTIHLLKQHPKSTAHLHLANSMSFDSLSDTAWRTARDTGALSYMPYNEAQRYSDLYMLGDLVTNKVLSTAEESFHAGSPIFMGYDITAMPDPVYDEMLRGNAATQMDLITLKQYIQQFDDQCVQELKH